MFRRILAFLLSFFFAPAPGPKEEVPLPQPGGGPQDQPPEGAGAEEYTILGGQREEKEVTVPATLEFFLTPGPKKYWMDQDLKAHFLWVRVGEFRGGRAPADPLEVGVRILGNADPVGGKVKALGPGGFAAEPRYGAPWAEGVPMFCRLVLLETGVVVTIGAGSTPIKMPLPRKVIVGYGDPPSGGRPAPYGSRISHARWL